MDFVRGEGAILVDDEGNEYLDFLSGISVASVGHSNPAVESRTAPDGRPLRLSRLGRDRAIGGSSLSLIHI